MTKRPYFLWDYDLTEADVRRLLREGSEFEKQWLVGRILSTAHFRDVWKYLTLDQLVAIFPKLRMRPVLRKYWQRALNVWGYHV